MRNLFLCAVILASAPTVSGQDCQSTFSPLIEGAKMEYHHFDKKDRLATVINQTIVAVEPSGDSVVATIASKGTDDKGKEMFNLLIVNC
jgi:hypothetical protein